MHAPSHHFSRLRSFAALAATLLVATATHAGDNGRKVALLPAYQQECGACHVAYPPSLMPRASWERLLGNLTQHFGTDASLDAAALKDVSTWVGSHAGTYRRVREEPPQDRVTRTEWFARKHREVSPATWKLSSVQSAARCAACHTTADQGDFDERHIRVPR